MAVIPANADLSTSEALKMAALVDPSFERTIGVLTKVDLMDQGTNILDIITGNSGRPLKLGYTGVVCRSQKDIMQNKQIKDAMVAEEKFFRSSIVYGSYAS